MVVKQEMEIEFISDDERDESNSLVPFVILESSGDESDLHGDFSERRTVVYERGNRKCFYKETCMHDDDFALEEKVLDEHLQESPIAIEALSYDQPGFEVPLAVVPPAPCQLLKDAYSIGNSSDLEGNVSESMIIEKSEAEKNENDVRDSLLDIASSSRGEVKISVMVNSSLRSDFHVPSLEAVLKQVEEWCLKSYRIPENGFSMLRLMNEFCEFFLAAGATSTCIEDVQPANETPSLGICEDPNSETCPAEGIGNQLSLFSKSTFSIDPVMIQNPFEGSSQIPRFIGSVHLDLSRCRIYLSVDASDSRGMGRSVLELSSCVPSLSRMMIAQKQRCYIEDITKGQESHEISLINEVNDDQGPTFNYISKSVVFQNAHVRFLLASTLEETCCFNCFGDCLSLEIPCACAVKTGCEFAYKPGGFVKEAFLDNFISANDSVQRHNLLYCQDCPLERCNGRNLSGNCKGHITTKFIKVCWYKFGCSMKCGNHVVQQGITAKLQVFMTPEQKGWGLRTLEDIPKGTFGCEYVGEVVTTSELFERKFQTNGDKSTYPVLLDANWSSKGVLKDEEALCLDATIYGNVARFINHRCFDANLVEIPVEVETPDRHYYHLAFFTTRKVNALEELTWDYGIDFNDNHPVKVFECRCDSKFCRDRKSLKRKLIFRESC